MEQQTRISTYVLPSVNKIALLLFGISLTLALISLFGAYVKNFTDYESLHRYVHHMIDKTYVDAELNIPTFYSTCLLLLSSILSAMAMFVQSRYKTKPYHWFVLSAVFFLLAMDEATSLHEFMNTTTIKTRATNSKYLQWTWVIPASLFTLLTFLFFVPFLKALPPRTAKLMMTAGVIYVGGAVGFEMIGSAMSVDNGAHSLSYLLVSHVEELLEMSGLVVFIYTLLDYFSDKVRRLTVHFASSRPVPKAG